MEDPNLSLVVLEESIIRLAFLIIVLGNNIYALLPLRRSELRGYLYIIWRGKHLKLGNSIFRKSLFLSSWFNNSFPLVNSRVFLVCSDVQIGWSFHLNRKHLSLHPTNLLKAISIMLSSLTNSLLFSVIQPALFRTDKHFETYLFTWVLNKLKISRWSRLVLDGGGAKNTGWRIH